MKKDQFNIDYKTISRVTKQVRLENILNFYFKGDNFKGRISDLPNRRFEDFIIVYPNEYKNLLNIFDEISKNDNTLIDLISGNKINAVNLYFKMMEHMFEPEVLDIFIDIFDQMFNSRTADSFSITDIEKEFFIALDDTSKLLQNIFLIDDILRITRTATRYQNSIFEPNKIKLENLYDDERNDWLLNYIIDNSNMRTNRVMLTRRNNIIEWIETKSHQRNTPETSFLLACVYFYDQTPDRQKIIYDAISNNIRVKKNKQKNKQVSILNDDHEKLKKIAKKISGGNVKQAISMLINNEFEKKVY